MGTVIEVALPFVAVLVGAAITYVLNVRDRRRTKVEDVFHEAISAVAVAQARHDFATRVGPWLGAQPGEYEAFTSKLGQEGQLAAVRSVADARAAIARASAYDPSLREYVGFRADFDAIADDVIARLRKRIE